MKIVDRKIIKIVRNPPTFQTYQRSVLSSRHPFSCPLQHILFGLCFPPSSCSLLPLLSLCFYSQRSSSEAHCRGPGLCELAGSSDGTNPRRGLSDQPVVSDGLPVAPGSYHSLNRRGSAVAAAHRKNPLAQEAGTGLWGSFELVWWVRR